MRVSDAPAEKIETLAAGLLAWRKAAVRRVLDAGRAAIDGDGVDIKAVMFGLADSSRMLHRAHIIAGGGKGAFLRCFGEGFVGCRSIEQMLDVLMLAVDYDKRIGARLTCSANQRG